MKTTKYCIASLVACCFLALNVEGSDIYWTGTTDMNWNEESNWSPASISLLSDNVTIKMAPDTTTSIMLNDGDTADAETLNLINESGSANVELRAASSSSANIEATVINMTSGTCIRVLYNTTRLTVTADIINFTNTLNEEVVSTATATTTLGVAASFNDNLVLKVGTLNVDINGSVSQTSKNGSTIGNINIAASKSLNFTSCDFSSDKLVNALHIGTISDYSNSKITFGRDCGFVLTGSGEINSSINGDSTYVQTIALDEGVSQTFTNETNTISNYIIGKSSTLKLANAVKASIALTSGGTLDVYTNDTNSIMEAVSIVADGASTITLDKGQSIALSGTLKKGTWTSGDILTFILSDDYESGTLISFGESISDSFIDSDFYTANGSISISSDGLNLLYAAIPEANRCAYIFGVIAVALVLYRRKIKI